MDTPAAADNVKLLETYFVHPYYDKKNNEGRKALDLLQCYPALAARCILKKVMEPAGLSTLFTFM
jgi:hypothetical protein